jgi:hypothetical protein
VVPFAERGRAKDEIAMSTENPKRSARSDERRALRKQLRQAGWSLGTKTRVEEGVTVELWPVPHSAQTAAAAGIEPRRVHGSDLLQALRNALQDKDDEAPNNDG